MSDSYGVDVDACRGRQQRMLELMEQNALDLVVVTQNEHIQWLTGARFPWLFQSIATLSADGYVDLIAPQRAPAVAAADNIVSYEAKWHSTMRNDQRLACCQTLQETWRTRPLPRRLGVEYSSYGRHFGFWDSAELVDVEPNLYQFRRRKDADEMSLLRKAISGTEKMYQLARQIIEPGIAELEVFNQLQAVAVHEFGEMLTGTGNDYQCGSRGGPPRNQRTAAAGELYILDLGPAFRGYFADNARTIAVTQADDTQQEAWSFIMQAFQHVESNVRPGKSCRELFNEVQAILDRAPCGVFNHHLGHGIGLFPHEGPHLNPNWDDSFEEGDVFTAEPGLYAPELRFGMRVENDYRVTADGAELLTEFGLEL
ncbi:MAG: Xaa-Pro dipeptidase [Pirellulaceae bacterium]|jgi:Xaa-Pro dipeptidase